MSIISKWLVIVVFDFNKIPHCTLWKSTNKKNECKTRKQNRKKTNGFVFSRNEMHSMKRKNNGIEKNYHNFSSKISKKKKDYAVELFLFFHFSIYFSTTRKTVVKITEDIELKKMGNQWFRNSSNHEELEKKYHKQKPTYKGYKLSWDI